MLCQKCGKRQATTYFQQTINGKTTALHLCSHCAEKYGMSDVFHTGFDLDDLFSGFLTNSFGTPHLNSTKICSKCRSTFDDIRRTGRVGCDQCYDVFRQELFPTLEQIHGKVEHVGKVSDSAGAEQKIKSQIAKLNQQLQKAVQEEAFEQAASLRDKIKELEQNLKQ